MPERIDKSATGGNIEAIKDLEPGDALYLSLAELTDDVLNALNTLIGKLPDADSRPELKTALRAPFLKALAGPIEVHSEPHNYGHKGAPDTMANIQDGVEAALKGAEERLASYLINLSQAEQQLVIQSFRGAVEAAVERSYGIFRNRKRDKQEF